MIINISILIGCLLLLFLFDKSTSKRMIDKELYLSFKAIKFSLLSTSSFIFALKTTEIVTKNKEIRIESIYYIAITFIIYFVYYYIKKRQN